MNESRIKYQFNACEQAVREVLAGLFAEKIVPPDRALADFFRNHRNCGSRDRAFINSCVYAILRRWGWLRKLMPQDFLSDIESGKINLQRRDIAAMTGFALICDNVETAVIREVLSVAGADMPKITAADAAGRAGEASVIFGKTLSFDCNMLAPDFRHLVPENWDYDGYMARLSQRPPMWIRFASAEGKKRTCRELDSLGVDYVEYNEYAAYVSGVKLNLFLLESFNAGCFEVQDLASQCAFLTAQALGADHSIVSFSGIGLDKGYSSINMQQFYTKDSYMRDNYKDYEVEERTPDIVVINLGTNDAAKGSTEDQLIANVKTLINTVRENYGEDTPIIWAYNMMGECRFDWTKKALEELGGEQKGIYSVKLTPNNDGGAGHPSVSGHATAAEELSAYIRSLGLAD